MAQAQPDSPARDPISPTDNAGGQQSIWRRFFMRDKDNNNNNNNNNVGSGQADASPRGLDQQDDTKAGLIRRVSRKVVPGLPRAQTFKRQQSELRDNLEPVQPTPAERRAVSMDRRLHATNSAYSQSNPRTSAPDFLSRSFSATASVPSLPTSPVEDSVLDDIGKLHELDHDQEEEDMEDLDDHVLDAMSNHEHDTHSMTTSQYDSMIHEELERIWILNLSMHFRDKSKREKFFVTYREHETLWRRVTVSLDYRNAPENSLELELVHTKFQRDKSAKIYEAIRESLNDIQFYDTVTNLKLQTTDGRLHVHVVEDVNEIVNYPTIRMIQHMRCRRVKESELEFDSHMSGFVYKVRVNNQMLIKKEIPGPDTVDEFLYEINALNRLRFAENVIQFYGVVVDDKEEYIKGLLISFADQGALIDVIYDHNHTLPWSIREKWARQIVNGLAEIHEAGFVQGDFTLSNIVINDENDAKIIDINRRGCPVGWEPPEATPLIESNQRISMYIGVKSDLYQLGMVLWALATQEDEPENHGRPLRIPTDVKVPMWYRQIVAICLSEDPRRRLQALQLASMFPDPLEESQYGPPNGSSLSVDDRHSQQEFGTESFNASAPRIKTVAPPSEWSYLGWGNPQFPATEDLFYYPTRGRSPPSPMPSNHGEYDAAGYGQRLRPWSENQRSALTAPSVSDVPPSELEPESEAAFQTRDEPQHGDDERRPRGPTISLAGVEGNLAVFSEHVQTQPATEKTHKPLNPGLSIFADAAITGNTEPGALGDGRKDASDSTPTPHASSITGSDVITAQPHGEHGEKGTGDGLRERNAYLTATPQKFEEGASDTTSEMRPSTSFSSSRATSSSTPTRGIPDDLKGIGSAYDLGLDQRQDSMTLEDDIGMDIGDPTADQPPPHLDRQDAVTGVSAVTKTE
ncbi:hypothetical protein B0H67DRAFT_553333 [Lasiosphaeris hirsuta]|uniref:Protein kinase domain-containing protein n=1 Tax=Lasiosphaeris hirsuta TaxID=260670 RepID=A0AA40AF05_9PEZI|nr:hypothetical protein B0H67DRAFT_553333 [Lasiosphaeris hirsuta]